MTIEDPRRYVRAMNFIKARIEDGSYKPHELMPPIQELSDETGHSRHTISKALRILQDQGLVARTPGLGYCAKARTATTSGLRPVTAANGHVGSPSAAAREAQHKVGAEPATAPVGTGLGGATHGDR